MKFEEANPNTLLNYNDSSLFNLLIRENKLDFQKNSNPFLFGKSLERIFSKSEFGEFHYYFRAGKNYFRFEGIQDSKTAQILIEFFEKVMTQILQRDFQLFLVDKKISVVFR